MSRKYFALVVIGIGTTVLFAVSPSIWAFHKWHCWWFATAPVCQ